MVVVAVVVVVVGVLRLFAVVGVVDMVVLVVVVMRVLGLVAECGLRVRSAVSVLQAPFRGALAMSALRMFCAAKMGAP